jgi:hypothetical protein
MFLKPERLLAIHKADCKMFITQNNITPRKLLFLLISLCRMWRCTAHESPSPKAMARTTKGGELPTSSTRKL